MLRQALAIVAVSGIVMFCGHEQDNGSTVNDGSALVPVSVEVEHEWLEGIYFDNRSYQMQTSTLVDELQAFLASELREKGAIPSQLAELVQFTLELGKPLDCYVSRWESAYYCYGNTEVKLSLKVTSGFEEIGVTARTFQLKRNAGPLNRQLKAFVRVLVKGLEQQGAFADIGLEERSRWPESPYYN